MRAAISQGTRRLQTTLPLIGLSFWQAWWMLLSTTHLMCGPRSYLGADAITIILVVSLAGYAAFTLAAPRMAPYSRQVAFIVTGAGCFAGSIILSVATHVALPATIGGSLELVGAVIMSLCNALLLLMWGECWATLAAGDVGRQLCVSFAFAFVLYFAVSALPTIMGIALNALLAPLSAWALAISQGLPRRTEPVAPVQLKPQPVVLVLACILLFSIAFGCMQRYAPSIAGSGSQRLSMMVAGAGVIPFALIMTIRQKAGDPFSFYRPIVPAVACGMLVCLMAPPGAAVVGNGVLIAGIYLLDMFMMFSASDLAYRVKMPVALVFGAAITTARAGTWLGTGLGIWLVSPDNPLDASGATAVVLAIACIVVIAGSVIFTETDLRSLYQASSKPHVPDLDERCEQIGKSAGLSARELDVMHLLARGRSVAVISEALGIAQGTVKHHASNTYRKLGVYDRQGLIDIVAGDADDPAERPTNAERPATAKRPARS